MSQIKYPQMTPYDDKDIGKPWFKKFQTIII